MNFVQLLVDCINPLALFLMGLWDLFSSWKGVCLVTLVSITIYSSYSIPSTACC